MRQWAGQGHQALILVFSVLRLPVGFFFLWFYTPGLRVGVYPLRPASCCEFIVLASLLCMTVCASLDPFLTMEPCSEFMPRFCIWAALELSLWPQRAASLVRGMQEKGLQLKTCLYCLCWCTFKQRQVQWSIPPWAIVSIPPWAISCSERCKSSHWLCVVKIANLSELCFLLWFNFAFTFEAHEFSF